MSSLLHLHLPRHAARLAYRDEPAATASNNLCGRAAARVMVLLLHPHSPVALRGLRYRDEPVVTPTQGGRAAAPVIPLLLHPHLPATLRGLRVTTFLHAGLVLHANVDADQCYYRKTQIHSAANDSHQPY